MEEVQYDRQNEVAIGVVRKDVIDAETGEIFQIKQTTSIDYGEERYKKTYNFGLETYYQYSDSARTKVLFYVLINAKMKSNILIATPDKIAADTKVGRSGVYRALNEMMEMNIIKRIDHAQWMLNPALTTDVNEMARYRQIRIYNAIGEEEEENNG